MCKSKCTCVISAQNIDYLESEDSIVTVRAWACERCDHIFSVEELADFVTEGSTTIH